MALTLSVKPIDVDAVTHVVIGGRNYYQTHSYNNVGQRIWGGSQFPAWTEYAEKCGLPIMPEYANEKNR